jgi:hypothetical protein
MALGANHRAHSRENYSFAKGVSAWWKPDGSSEWRHLGALTGIGITPREERFSHFTNVLGGRAKDLDIVVQRELAISFTLEELNRDNLQLAFGSKAAAQVGTRDVSFARVHKNPGGALTIKLGQTDIKNVVIRGPLLEGAEVTYVAGAGNDYTVDLATGIVTILAGGDLEDEEVVPKIHIAYEKEVSVQEFKIWTGEALEGDFKLQRIGKSGAPWVLQVRGSLRNNGDVPLGDGSALDSIPMSLEAFVDEGDDLGDFALVNAGEL